MLPSRRSLAGSGNRHLQDLYSWDRCHPAIRERSPTHHRVHTCWRLWCPRVLVASRHIPRFSILFRQRILTTALPSAACISQPVLADFCPSVSTFGKTPSPSATSLSRRGNRLLRADRSDCLPSPFYILSASPRFYQPRRPCPAPVGCELSPISCRCCFACHQLQPNSGHKPARLQYWSSEYPPFVRHRTTRKCALRAVRTRPALNWPRSAPLHCPPSPSAPPDLSVSTSHK